MEKIKKAFEERRKRKMAWVGDDKRKKPFSYTSNGSDTLISMFKSALGDDILNLLLDDMVEELRVNPDGLVWEVRNGFDHRTEFTLSPETTDRVISIVAHHAKVEVNESNPSFAAELPESGYRFHGVIPPQLQHPAFVIRKKPKQVFSLEEYVEQGIITKKQREILIKAVTERDNILIVGGTSSGKTTLTNAILFEIAKTGDRVLTVEDTLELVCQSEDKVMMRTVSGSRTMQQCIRDMLRMTPKRIIVGEVRGPEVIDMLGGWNTGHPGGVATIHANSAAESLERIEDLFKQGGAIPSRRAIARTINIIVFMDKFIVEDAGQKISKRRIKEILRITGIDENENYLFEKID